MQVLNNLLENREMSVDMVFSSHCPLLIFVRRNLDDGTHIIHQDRYFMLESSLKHDKSGKTLIPAHKNFRVIAIAAPVPPYTGYPIDPPFRSRFQSRFVDPIGALLSLPSAPKPFDASSSVLHDKLQEIVLSTQYASEAQSSVDATAKSTIRPFPQTALVKLRALLSVFPAPSELSPEQLAKLILALHPGLLHAPFVVWGLLSRQTEEAGLGALGNPSLSDDGDDDLGLLGYRLASVQRKTDRTISVSFVRSDSSTPVVVDVPGGPRPLLEFPWKNPRALGFLVTNRFMGLLTCILQAHSLGWDITYIPPVLPSTASCSTTLLVRTFGAILGYEVESVHMYKELGGRELVMRRKVEDGGATTWEPR